MGLDGGHRLDLFQDLQTAMLDLALELRECGVLLIVGGGYGLYVWQTYLFDKYMVGGSTRTMLPPEFWPEARSTQDLDIFLTGEVVTGHGRFSAVRDSLERLGYESVNGREHWQFVKRLDDSKSIIVDIITGPVDGYEEKVQADYVRVRPRRIPVVPGGQLPPKVKMHAY